MKSIIQFVERQHARSLLPILRSQQLLSAEVDRVTAPRDLERAKDPDLQLRGKIGTVRDCLRITPRHLVSPGCPESEMLGRAATSLRRCL